MDYNGEPEETDLETMELIIQMQLLDLDDLKEHEPEKKTDGESTDTDFAIQLMEDDLNTIRQTLADRRMVNSISGAVRENQQMITMMQEQENVAHQDRTLAIRLADSVQHQNTNAQERQVHEESLSSPDRSRSPQSLQTSPTRNPSNEDDQIEENEPESSSWAAERNKHNTRTRKVCVACTQSKPYFDVIAATCQHEYCRDCLQELFRASFTDESLFPPRCCRQDVALDQVSVLLNNELISEFERKRIEFGTTNRTYCAQATCSAFIPPAAINIHIGTCPECSSQTCTTCKLLAHHDMECPNDPALQALNELAQQSGWQKCPSCYRLVELDIGCNHMTCLCRTEFCYLCGARWKTCDCPQWNEDRLLARANQLVNRDTPRLPANNPQRANLVVQAVNELQARHNCNHTSWAYRSGRFQCEECRDYLPQFIFECRQCRILACNRCRRNRL